MGFLLGLLVGVSVSGSQTPPAGLSQIPMRCLYAIEHDGDDAYRRCRRATLDRETATGSETREGLEWEIGALHEIIAAAKSQKSTTN